MAWRELSPWPGFTAVPAPVLLPRRKHSWLWYSFSWAQRFALRLLALHAAALSCTPRPGSASAPTHPWGQQQKSTAPRTSPTSSVSLSSSSCFRGSFPSASFLPGSGMMLSSQLRSCREKMHSSPFRIPTRASSWGQGKVQVSRAQRSGLGHRVALPTWMQVRVGAWLCSGRRQCCLATGCVLPSPGR